MACWTWRSRYRLRPRIRARRSPMALGLPTPGSTSRDALRRARRRRMETLRSWIGSGSGRPRQAARCLRNLASCFWREADRAEASGQGMPGGSVDGGPTFFLPGAYP